MTRNVLASRSWEWFLANSQQGTGTSVLQAQRTEFCQQLKDPGSGFFPGPPSKSPTSHSLNHNLEIPLAKNPVSQAGFLTHGNHKIINKCCFWTAMFVVICYTAIADWYMILLLLPGREVKWSEAKSLSHVRVLGTPWAVAYQDPRSMGFSRQEYWSGLPFPSPGDLPDPGIKPGSPAL